LTDPKDALQARKAEIAKIEKESLESTGLRSDVVAVHTGAITEALRKLYNAAALADEITNDELRIETCSIGHSSTQVCLDNS
jgi:pantoate kinase